jgi:hypothetical protein
MTPSELQQTKPDVYDTDKFSRAPWAVQWHSYGPFYDAAFTPRRETITSICEIGIQTGGSLRLWRDYFPNARVMGVDLRSYPLSLCPGCELLSFDAYSMAEWHRHLPGERFDLLIDDGSHHPAHQLWCARALPALLRPGGLLIIEDATRTTAAAIRSLGIDAELHDGIATSGMPDDVLLAIRAK